MSLSCFRAISGMGMDGWVWDLCAGQFYEHRFAMLISPHLCPLYHSLFLTLKRIFLAVWILQWIFNSWCLTKGFPQISQSIVALFTCFFFSCSLRFAENSILHIGSLCISSLCWSPTWLLLAWLGWLGGIAADRWLSNYRQEHIGRHHPTLAYCLVLVLVVDLETDWWHPKTGWGSGAV